VTFTCEIQVLPCHKDPVDISAHLILCVCQRERERNMAF